MMKKYFIVLTVLILPSCTNSDKRIKDLSPEANVIGEKMYQALSKSDYDYVYKLFNRKPGRPLFLDSLKTILQDIKQSYGHPISYKQIDSKYHKEISTEGNEEGIYCLYEVIYSSGFKAIETLVYDMRDSTKSLTGIDGYEFSKAGK